MLLEVNPLRRKALYFSIRSVEGSRQRLVRRIPLRDHALQLIVGIASVRRLRNGQCLNYLITWP